MRMKAVILTSVGLSFCVSLTLACGQKSASPQSGTFATPNKGQIAQPTVFRSKGADASSLLISFHGCADLLLTDAQNRNLGYDAIAKKSYVQIPGGIYDEGDLIFKDADGNQFVLSNKTGLTKFPRWKQVDRATIPAGDPLEAMFEDLYGNIFVVESFRSKPGTSSR